jgi:hypothetical protein
MVNYFVFNNSRTNHFPSWLPLFSGLISSMWYYMADVARCRRSEKYPFLLLKTKDFLWVNINIWINRYLRKGLLLLLSLSFKKYLSRTPFFSFINFLSFFFPWYYEHVLFLFIVSCCRKERYRKSEREKRKKEKEINKDFKFWESVRVVSFSSFFSYSFSAALS